MIQSIVAQTEAAFGHAIGIGIGAWMIVVLVIGVILFLDRMRA